MSVSSPACRASVRLRNASARRIHFLASPLLPASVGPFAEVRLAADPRLAAALQPWLAAGVVTLDVDDERPLAQVPLRNRALAALRQCTAIGILTVVCLCSVLAVSIRPDSNDVHLNHLAVILAVAPGLMYLIQERRARAAMSERLRRASAQIDARSLPRRLDDLGDAASSDEREPKFEVGAGRLAQLCFGSAIFAACLGKLVLPPDAQGTSPLLQLMTPASDVVPRAFFGSYVLTLHLFRRGFVRKDLTSSMFTSAVLRLLVTALIASSLEGILRTNVTAPYLDVVSFALGFWPALGLGSLARATNKALQTKVLSAAGNSAARPLIGMDHLQFTRLEECGIESIADLARAEPIALLHRSQIAEKSLFAAMDQALLVTRLPDADFEKLRARGVTCATDVVALHRAHADLPEGSRLPSRFVGLGHLLEIDEDVRALLRWRAHVSERGTCATSPADFERDPADLWRIHDGKTSSQLEPGSEPEPESAQKPIGSNIEPVPLRNSRA